MPRSDSSSSPWILAELQKALETKPEADSYASPEGEGYSGDGAIEGVAADGDGGPLGAASEVMVVRVALPSAVEREQVRSNTGGAHRSVCIFCCLTRSPRLTAVTCRGMTFLFSALSGAASAASLSRTVQIVTFHSIFEIVRCPCLPDQRGAALLQKAFLFLLPRRTATKP